MISSKIGILDYGMGNISSLKNALVEVGGQPVIVKEPGTLENLNQLILPGVGAFSDAINLLKKKNFIAALNDYAGRGKKILGICLGMQLMCNSSSENGKHTGFGWFDASVEKIHSSSGIKVPHIGWNSVEIVNDNNLFQNIQNFSDFYFVHSFKVKCNKESEILTKTCHGVNFTSGIKRKNICGVQFHPEKSQSSGLNFLKNFLEKEYA